MTVLYNSTSLKFLKKFAVFFITLFTLTDKKNINMKMFILPIHSNLIDFFSSFLEVSFLDIPTNYSFGFQDPCTPSAIAIQDLHWSILTILYDVFIFVCTLLILTLILFAKRSDAINNNPNHFSNQLKNKIETYLESTMSKTDIINSNQLNHKQKFNESTSFEFFVTAFSSVLLLFIGVPGIAALYSLEEALTPVLNIKVLGKQWQWSYEYSDYTNLETGQTISFDSAPVFASDDPSNPVVFHLLSVDNNLVVPANVPINFVITSTDVLHSWAVPSAGIKMDAVPGRLNSFTTVFNREGTFYGQCSELCGQGHALMPICVKAVSSQDYLTFIKEKLAEL